MEGLANIAIHRFSMNNNQVIRRTCLLVQKEVLNMLGKPGCSGLMIHVYSITIAETVLLSLLVMIIHVQTTPIIHEYALLKILSSRI